MKAEFLNKWRTASLVPSFSGGKDSTYLVLRLHELGIKMADIVYFDTGWEFPYMDTHISQVEEIIRQKITRLAPREGFNFLFAQKIRAKKSKYAFAGYGWPSATRRWCTGQKQRALSAYAKALTWQGLPLPVVQCIGYAADESKRAEKHSMNNPLSFQGFDYPMLRWGVTEAQALAYCKERGLLWDGLYDIFNRVSCWCCPLGGISNAEKIYRNFPELWQRMLEMESWLPEKYRRYTGKYTVSELDRRFAESSISSTQ